METQSKGKQHANPEPGPSHHRSPTTLYTPSDPPNTCTKVSQIEELPEEPEEQEGSPYDSEYVSGTEGSERSHQSQQPQQLQWQQAMAANEAAWQLFQSLMMSLQTFNDAREPPNAKLQEPNTFTRQDLQKLWSFLMQCHFQFRDQPSAFKDNIQKVNFTLSYLHGQAFQWFEPRFSRWLNEEPLWLNNWDKVV
jgi:hypothetical protein